MKSAFASLIMLVALASSANAQNTIAPAPAAAPAAAYFPALPPSHQCTGKDIWGIWKLAQVYENPAGATMADYNAHPYQYAFFNKNSLFKESKNAQPVANPDLQRIAKEQAAVVEQFVVGDTGFVYFYQNSAATSTMACFIVANDQAPFLHGQMLLMPPAPAKDQAASRMVKVYQKVIFGRPMRRVVVRRHR